MLNVFYSAIKRFRLKSGANAILSLLPCWIEGPIGENRPTFREDFFFTVKNRPITDGEISIKDLSRAGLGFNLLSASKGAFVTGDVLRVQFKLFQNSSLLIKKEAVVKQVNGLRVNATFREPLKTEDDFLLKLFFYT